MHPTRLTRSLHLGVALAACASLNAQATESGVDNIGPGTDGFYVLPLSPDQLPEHMFAFNLYYNHYQPGSSTSAPLAARSRRSGSPPTRSSRAWTT